MDQTIEQESFQVTIDLSTQLDTNDLDFLNLFLESKKQSGGGDITKTELLNTTNQLVIFYEDKQAQQRILTKKYLQFKNYQLKATLNGLFNEPYQIEANQLIVTNINSKEDEFYIKLYAENLLATTNQVIQIQKSKIFPNTIRITYSQEIQRDLLQKRFPMCSLYKNEQLNLVDSLETKSFVIKSTTNRKIDLNALKSQIELKFTEPFFLKEIKNYCLFQSDTASDLDHLISDYLVATQLICEHCYNLSLFNLPEQLDTNDKMVQTDQIVAMVTNNPTNDNYLLELNANDLYIDALINAKQLFVNFDEILKKLDKNFTMKLNHQTKSIQIRNQSNQLDSQWKQKILNELKKYFTSRAMFKAIKTPQEIQNNINHLEQLKLKLNKINKECPALFFRLEPTGDINCYGTKNALINKLDTFTDLFKSITKQEAIKQDEPNLPTVDLDPNSTAFKLFSNIPQLFYDFKNILKESNADLVRDSTGNMIQIICLKLVELDSQQWCQRIRLLVEEHERSRLRIKKIAIPLNLKRQKELDDLKKHCEHFYAKEKTLKYELKSNECLTVYGYATQVKSFNDNIQSKFSNLENNIKDRIRRKLEVKIESNRVPLITMLTIVTLFKEFNNQLSKLEAMAELVPINQRNCSIKIKCLMNATKSQNEQLVEQWRTKIDSFILSYFSQFSTKRFKCKKNDLKLDDKQVRVIWIEPDTVELTGLKTDVDRLELELSRPLCELNKENQLPKLMDLEPRLTADKSDPKKEETFLISDLKWFQTRMLFEKKYFLFVTEAYKELSVLVDTQLTRIFYTGKKKDIDEAKKLAFDILDQILGTEMESNLALNEKLIENEQKLNALIKTNGLCCIVDAKTNADKYTIYATTYEDIERCRTLLTGIHF